MSRPRIGIISYLEENKESVFRFRQNMINEAYTSALLESGAIPSIIPSIGDKEAIDLLLSSVDGILIPGGADIDPSLYGEESEGLSQKTNKDQDLFQKDIILRALDMHKCIMGICRGHQIVNVTLGGKLFQDIPSQVPNATIHKDISNAYTTSHAIRIEENSMLRQAVGSAMIKVNTLHHQAVRIPGCKLAASAWAEDGLIEATEDRERRIITVQWHPEAIQDQEEERERNLRIFRFFASLARK